MTMRDLRVPRSLGLIAAIATSLLLGGCAKQETPAGPEAKAKPAAQAPAKAPEQPEPRLAEIPEALRHDGFRYSGLGRQGTLTFAVTGARPEEQESAQTFTLAETREDAAEFTIRRTGAMGQFGAETVRVDSTGVTIVRLEQAELAAPTKQLPASLAPGTEWRSRMEVTTQDGRSAAIDFSLRVERPERVETRAGEFDSLLVTGSGHMVAGETRTPVTVRQWLVRDLGVVKQELVQSPPNAAATTIRLELVRK
jgi:hypothetical protein